jgi:hypothetical protein
MYLKDFKGKKYILLNLVTKLPVSVCLSPPYSDVNIDIIEASWSLFVNLSTEITLYKTYDL